MEHFFRFTQFMQMVKKNGRGSARLWKEHCQPWNTNLERLERCWYRKQVKNWSQKQCHLVQNQAKIIECWLGTLGEVFESKTGHKLVSKSMPSGPKPLQDRFKSSRDASWTPLWGFIRAPWRFLEKPWAAKLIFLYFFIDLWVPKWVDLTAKSV